MQHRILSWVHAITTQYFDSRAMVPGVALRVLFLLLFHTLISSHSCRELIRLHSRGLCSYQALWDMALMGHSEDGV